MALASNNIANSLLSKSLLIGMTVTTLINCFGRISGAHFNPAVSCYLFSKNLMSKFELTTYVFSQILGSSIVVLGFRYSSILLKEIGQNVKSGDVIAIIGNSGSDSTGPHLHFELWHNGIPINPIANILF